MVAASRSAIPFKKIPADVPAVGTNLVWIIQSQLCRSLATSNTTDIEKGFARMWQDVVISNITREDLQTDRT